MLALLGSGCAAFRLAALLYIVHIESIRVTRIFPDDN